MERHKDFFSPTDTSGNVEYVIRQIENSATDITQSYENWRNVGFAFVDEFGESGRYYFHRVSKFYSGYSERENDKQYNACIKAKGANKIHIGTFFQLAKDCGFDIQIPQKNIESGSKANFKEVSASANSAKSTEKEKRETLPTFSQDIATLPNFLSKIMVSAQSEEESDLLVLGTLTILSACMPNVYGIYDENEVFPNLYLFVTAPAASGKSRLKMCRKLVAPILAQMRDLSELAMEEYKLQLATYMQRKEKGLDLPKKPPYKSLFLPANSSVTSMYQNLYNNGGVGIIFETEGDTLSLAFKSDYGNYSDGFRKAFHHEPITYSRRKEEEFIEIETPKLSVLLSGTPQQITQIVPSTENGLFSRFMFYYLEPQLSWKNVFVKSDNTLSHFFEEMGVLYFEYYNKLKGNGEIYFSFTEEQGKEFNRHFEELQQQYFDSFSYDIVASVRRLGVVCYRIAMIVSVLRMCESGIFVSQLICSDEDYETAKTIVDVLIVHTSYVYKEIIPEHGTYTKSVNSQQWLTYYDTLPTQFERTEYIKLAKELGLPERTAERHISQWCAIGKLIRIKQGLYEKK